MIPSQEHIAQEAAVSSKLARQEIKRVSEALRDGRMELFYQPIVRSGVDGFIAFFEGLARIRMPDDSVVAAGQFMPFIENTPLGRLVDCKTLNLAFDCLEENLDIRLSINLSTHSMSDKRWNKIFDARATGLGERLILEITEGAAMSDIEKTAAFLEHTRSFGCSIALDDFGTGSTAFRYFRDFKFDIVKIDGLFIRDLPHNKDNRVLVEALVKISEHFDMFTVAEFVETEGEASVAAELGVDCLQGYLIGKPTELPELPFWNFDTSRKSVG